MDTFTVVIGGLLIMCGSCDSSVSGWFGADWQDVAACLPPHFEQLWSCLQATQGRPALNVKHTPLTLGCFPLNPKPGLRLQNIGIWHVKSLRDPITPNAPLPKGILGGCPYEDTGTVHRNSSSPPQVWRCHARFGKIA